MRWQKPISLVALLTLVLLSSSCGILNKTVLYPITDKDIYFKDGGDVCMSEFYFKEVLQMKLKEK